jgi:hypothetical protein
MASYKVEVTQRLGKFHTVIWQATAAKPNVEDSPALDSVADCVKTVEAEIEERGINLGADSLTFRGIAYEDLNSLTREIKMGTY